MFIISSGYRRFWCIFITNKHLPLSQCIPDNADLCLCMGVRERKWWETNYLNLKWINPFCLSKLGEWGNTERQLNTWKIFIKSQKIKVGGLSTLVKNTDGTTFVLRCDRSLLLPVEQWGGAFYIIFCFLVFNTEVCLHMWMYKDVYSSHTCVEMNQRALHGQSCSLHPDSLQEQAGVIHLWVLTLRHPGRTCFSEAEPVPSLGHLIQSLEVVNTLFPALEHRLPSQKTELLWDTQNWTWEIPGWGMKPGEGGEAAEAALLLPWPLVGPG